MEQSDPKLIGQRSWYIYTLCIPCKMMEKLVEDAIVNHMTLNNLFSNSQYGFRLLQSCALQLLDVMET